MMSAEALRSIGKLKYTNTVLDIGSGPCEQAKWLLDNTDKQVTCTDLVGPHLGLTREGLVTLRVCSKM